MSYRQAGTTEDSFFQQPQFIGGHVQGKQAPHPDRPSYDYPIPRQAGGVRVYPLPFKEVGVPRPEGRQWTSASPVANEVKHSSATVRLTALLVDFIAHQP